MLRKRRQPTCHPDRPHCAKGLCRPCYRHTYHILNLDRAHKLTRLYYEKHRDQTLDHSRRWAVLNRDKVRHYHRKYDQRNSEKRREIMERWITRHRDSYLQGRKIRRLKYEYGLSREQYERMITNQDGRCAICKRAVRLEIDHDHKSGNVRGLLCRECNLAVGGIELSGASPISIAQYLGFPMLLEL